MWFLSGKKGRGEGLMGKGSPCLGKSNVASLTREQLTLQSMEWFVEWDHNSINIPRVDRQRPHWGHKEWARAGEQQRQQQSSAAPTAGGNARRTASRKAFQNLLPGSQRTSWYHSNHTGLKRDLAAASSRPQEFTRAGTQDLKTARRS